MSIAPSPRSASVASGAGSAPDVDGGRMELHEFRVGDHGAGASGHGDAVAARLARIGGDGVELADAAGREHHGARRQRMASRRTAAVDAPQADDLARHRQQQISAVKPSITRIEGVARTAATSAAMIARAGRVALDMQDAARGHAPPRGRQHELAFEVLVERHAIARADPRPAPGPRAPAASATFSSTIPAPARDRIARHDARRCRLRPSPRRCRPAPMGSRRLRRAARPRRPSRARRELERAEQTGKAAADDDHVVGSLCTSVETGCAMSSARARLAVGFRSVVEVDHPLDRPRARARRSRDRP